VQAGGDGQTEPALTEHERHLLRLVARGLGNREIAQALAISERTVRAHLSGVLHKLRVEDRTQAALWAVKHGLGEDTP
jgi:DNA-binding NarL/FixJ family response regulator